MALRLNLLFLAWAPALMLFNMVGCEGKSDAGASADDSGANSEGSGGASVSASASSAASNTTGTSGTSVGAGGTSVGAGGTSATGATGTSNTSGTGPTTNGSSSTTSTGTGTTGGTLANRCQLPLDGGQCEAYFSVYGYNSTSGVCEPFVYGGCGGNDNRFDSLDECLEACAPEGRTACQASSDCVVDHGCCGYCDISGVEDLVAVHRSYAGFNAPGCAALDCDWCPAPPEIEHFGAQCQAGRCELFDVRESGLAECTEDSDCRLRAGLGCCEACDSTGMVAVSADFDTLSQALCSDEPLACPPCVPVYPEDVAAVCGEEGHCRVQVLPF